MQNLSLKSYLTLRNLGYLLLIAPIFIIIMLFLIDDSDDFSNVGTASYVNLSKQQSCSTGKLNGEKGATYGEQTREGIKYNVRAPLNYDKTIAHPLLVVYAPAKANRAKSEKLTNLTYQATTAGFIIAYAGDRRCDTAHFIFLHNKLDIVKYGGFAFIGLVIRWRVSGG